MNDLYPMGFDGIEGEEEETYVFYIQGEIDIEDYSEEGAEEQLLDMTVRELLTKGIHLDQEGWEWQASLSQWLMVCSR